MMRISTGESRRRSLSGPGNSAAAAAGDAPKHDGAARLLHRIGEFSLPALDLAARTSGAQQKRMPVLRQLGATEPCGGGAPHRASASSARRLFVAAGWEILSARAAPPDAAGFGERDELAQLGKTQWHNRMLWARSLRRLCAGTARDAQLAASLLSSACRPQQSASWPCLHCAPPSQRWRRSRRPRVIRRSQSRSSLRDTRRTAGPSHPVARRAPRPGAGSGYRGGEPARRGWQRRDAGKRRAALPDGYTLVVAGQGPSRAQPAHVRQPRLQRDRRLRADHPDRARPTAARGESGRCRCIRSRS